MAFERVLEAYDSENDHDAVFKIIMNEDIEPYFTALKFLLKYVGKEHMFVDDPALSAMNSAFHAWIIEPSVAAYMTTVSSWKPISEHPGYKAKYKHSETDEVETAGADQTHDSDGE